MFETNSSFAGHKQQFLQTWKSDNNEVIWSDKSLDFHLYMYIATRILQDGLSSQLMLSHLI